MGWCHVSRQLADEEDRFAFGFGKGRARRSLQSTQMSWRWWRWAERRWDKMKMSGDNDVRQRWGAKSMKQSPYATRQSNTLNTIRWSNTLIATRWSNVLNAFLWIVLNATRWSNVLNAFIWNILNALGADGDKHYRNHSLQSHHGDSGTSDFFQIFLFAGIWECSFFSSQFHL